MPQDGLRAVNSFALVSGDHLTLIDPGVDVEPAREALDTALAALGAGVGDIATVLVTHFHYDHYSRAIALQEALGTRVAMGAFEAPSIRALQHEDEPLNRQARQLQSYGADDLAENVARLPSNEHINRLVARFPGAWITDNQVVPTGAHSVQVLHTPGHTHGHVVFRDATRGLLFAGDHVLPSITPSIGFEPAGSALPLHDYLESLARVRALPDARLLPAHGAVTESVHRRIDDLVAHHDERLLEITAAVTDGASTAAEVAAQIRWTRRERNLTELDVFNRMLAVLETGYHLDLLHERGELERTCDEGVRRYSPSTTTQTASG